MSTFAYYNEIDPQAGAWLYELMSEGLIPRGFVDDRSIIEVLPADLRGFTQHHFFAGIGGWPYALRLAGWPDDREVWTGSCPCQPFSAAGKGAGFDDARHLWPEWRRLICECRPPTVFGEQVASKAGLGWFDLVHADLEHTGYAVGAADLAAASVGAPHIRQRLYFGAHRLGHRSGDGRLERWAESGERGTERRCGESGVANTGSERRQQISGSAFSDEDSDGWWSHGNHQFAGNGTTGRLAESDGGNASAEGGEWWSRLNQEGGQRKLPPRRPGAWDDIEWLPCLDGKSRPAQPGIFPLASGVPNRVALLRGAGNSIVAPLAQAFVEAWEAAVE